MRENMMETKEAAKYLGIAPETLANWCSAKRIPYYRVGNRRRFKVEDLNAYIEGSRIEAAK